MGLNPVAICISPYHGNLVAVTSADTAITAMNVYTAITVECLHSLSVNI